MIYEYKIKRKNDEILYSGVIECDNEMMFWSEIRKIVKNESGVCVYVKSYEKEDSNRPPTGIMPKSIFEEKVRAQRLEYLKAAIERYIDSGLTLKQEWIDEYNELLKNK